MSYFENLSAEAKVELQREFESKDTTEERRIELLTYLQEAADEAEMSRPCPRCKHRPFFAPFWKALIEGHVYSHDGMREVGITHYCEFCFDLITKEPDEEEPEPGTLEYAQWVAERYGDLDEETEEETR